MSKARLSIAVPALLRAVSSLGSGLSSFALECHHCPSTTVDCSVPSSAITPTSDSSTTEIKTSQTVSSLCSSPSTIVQTLSSSPYAIHASVSFSSNVVKTSTLHLTVIVTLSHASSSHSSTSSLTKLPSSSVLPSSIPNFTTCTDTSVLPTYVYDTVYTTLTISVPTINSHSVDSTTKLLSSDCTHDTLNVTSSRPVALTSVVNPTTHSHSSSLSTTSSIIYDTSPSPTNFSATATTATFFTDGARAEVVCGVGSLFAGLFLAVGGLGI